MNLIREIYNFNNNISFIIELYTERKLFFFIQIGYKSYHNLKLGKEDINQINPFY